MNLAKALASGAVGATVLTLIHETARQIVPDAPRADVLGMRALAKVIKRIGAAPPSDPELHKAALTGDLISNTVYYGLVGTGSDRAEAVWTRGAALGLAAGLGTVVLPPLLGLGKKPSARNTKTAAMTVVWYMAGGLAAAAAYRLLPGDE